MNTQELANYFKEGEKKPENFIQGIEWELFIVDDDTLRQIPYYGARGVAELLKLLGKELGLEHSRDKVNSNIVGLKGKGYSVTLEPGGQVELSGSMFRKISEAEKETVNFLSVLKDICSKLRLSVMTAPYHPLDKVDEVPTIPKTRYEHLGCYFRDNGLTLAEHMRKLTTSVQTSIDYSSEKDFVKKLRAANLLSPIFSAIYANSPIVRNKLSSYMSYRGNVWQHTEAVRCGIVKDVFSDDFGYALHAENLAHIPVVEGFNGENPGELRKISLKKYIDDAGRFDVKWWENHLSFVFTVVRAKNFIEIRCFDNQNSIERVLSVPALVKGLFYSSDEILDEIFNITAMMGKFDFFRIKHEVSRFGLDTVLNDVSFLEISQKLYKLAKRGLSAYHKEEVKYLEPLEEILFHDRQSPGKRIAELWKTRGKDVLNMKDLYLI